jgi:hypothetical protein
MHHQNYVCIAHSLYFSRDNVYEPHTVLQTANTLTWSIQVAIIGYRPPLFIKLKWPRVTHNHAKSLMSPLLVTLNIYTTIATVSTGFRIYGFTLFTSRYEAYADRDCTPTAWLEKVFRVIF